MAANAGETKVKLWEGICYPENMRDDWQDEIDDILQVPFAYAVHDIVRRADWIHGYRRRLVRVPRDGAADEEVQA